MPVSIRERVRLEATLFSGSYKVYFCKLQLMPFPRFASCIAAGPSRGYCEENPQNRVRHEASFENTYWRRFPARRTRRPQGAVLFQQIKIKMLYSFLGSMEGIIHILLALAVILLVERLIQAGNV